MPGGHTPAVSASRTTGRAHVHPVPGHGAEDVLVADDGSVYTGTDDGVVHRLDPRSGEVTEVARTHGRPLGLEWLPDGRLLVCDAVVGLLAVDLETARVETLVGLVGGRPMRFCNNAAVSSVGDVWFSDSSLHHGLEGWKDEMVEHNRSGRLLRRRPDGTVTVELDDLAFANGVALAGDESFVAVAETGARTVVRLWLTGPRADQRDYLVKDLPGYPDNIARGSDGLIWVSLASPTDPVLERLQRAPMLLKRLLLRLPDALQPGVKRSVRAVALDDQGRTVHEVDLDPDDFHMATGVREHDGALWIGSLVEPAVATVQLV